MCFQRICPGADRNRRGGVSGQVAAHSLAVSALHSAADRNPPRGVRGNRALRAAPQGTAGSPRPQGAKRGRLAASLHRGAELFGRHAGAWSQAVRPHAGALQSLASAAAAVKRYQRLPEAESSSCSSGSAAEGGCGAGSLSKSSPRSSLSACCRNQSSRMRQEAAAV